jgi:hypothetical protein
MEVLQEELRQVFLFEVCYQSGLHQKPPPLFSVALIEIKRGGMFGSGAMSGAQEAGQITPFHVNYPDYATALAHSHLMVWGAFPPSLNPETGLFLKSNSFVGGMIAQISLGKGVFLTGVPAAGRSNIFLLHRCIL